MFRNNVWAREIGPDGAETPAKKSLKVLIVEVAQERGDDMNFNEFDFLPYTDLAHIPDTGKKFNTFGGFPFQEMPGRFEEMDWTPIQPFLDFMKILMCNKPKPLQVSPGMTEEEVEALNKQNETISRTNDTIWKFTQSYFADMVQNPQRKPRIALVLFSKAQQVGKSKIIEWLCGTLYGRYFLQCDDANHVFGDFTKFLEKHMAINVDDPDKNGSSEIKTGRVKHHITEKSCSITGKGKDPYCIRSCHRWIWTINDLGLLNIELLDERFFVLAADPIFQYNKEKFEMLDELVENNRALIWNYFKKLPIDKYWNRKVPMTDAKRTALEAKFPSVVQFVIRNPDFWLGQQLLKEHIEKPRETPPPPPPIDLRWHWDKLYHLYKRWIAEQQIECGIFRKAESLREPLQQMLKIKDDHDGGRVRILNSEKPSGGRDKGFQISRVDLIRNIREFLERMGETTARDWEPPSLPDPNAPGAESAEGAPGIGDDEQQEPEGQDEREDDSP